MSILDRFRAGLRAGYSAKRDGFVVTRPGTYQLDTSFTPGHMPEAGPTETVHAKAAHRLTALAAVFDQAGNYAAADCCESWAAQARQHDPIGQQIAWAIGEGVFPDGS
jgi:hypothetical protein